MGRRESSLSLISQLLDETVFGFSWFSIQFLTIAMCFLTELSVEHLSSLFCPLPPDSSAVMATIAFETILPLNQWAL